MSFILVFVVSAVRADMLLRGENGEEKSVNFAWETDARENREKSADDRERRQQAALPPRDPKGVTFRASRFGCRLRPSLKMTRGGSFFKF